MALGPPRGHPQSWTHAKQGLRRVPGRGKLPGDPQQEDACRTCTCWWSLLGLGLPVCICTLPPFVATSTWTTWCF